MSLFNEVLRELRNRGEVQGPDRNGDYIAFCPFHPDKVHPNLHIHPEKGFYCFACGAKGSIKKLAHELGISFSSEYLDQVQAIQKLMDERCLSMATLAHFKIEADVRKQAWKYPVNGGYRYKAFNSKAKHKYWHDEGVKNQLHGLNDIPDGSKEVWLVNGEPAVWTMWQVGVPAVCGIFGEGKIPADAVPQLKDKGVARIDYVADKDEAGEIAAKLTWRVLNSDFEVIPKKLPNYLSRGADIADLYHWCGGDNERFKQALEELENVDTLQWEVNESTFSLPIIIVNDRHLRDITSDALDALYKTNDPPSIFRRLGSLCRVNVDEDGRPFAERLDEAIFRGCLERVADFVFLHGDPPVAKTRPVAPPIAVVQDCLSLGTWDFPPLTNITQTPVIRPDGSILSTPGYDRDTRLYYASSGDLSIPNIPDNPSKEEVEAATNLVLEPLQDFPFDCKASRANTLAAILTPLLRPLIDGPTPMFLFDKPQPGTGATLLADVISQIVAGGRAGMMAPQHNDEEWRKAITSQLLKGPSIIIIDNIAMPLTSDALGAVLTSTWYEDRVLGRSEIVNLPNRALWIATGNNIEVKGDLPRRCIWVRMDAQQARPWLRDKGQFKHPELLKWVRESRANILAAAFTIIRGWVTASRPEPKKTQSLGTYEDFCQVVGGILEYIGVEDFLENLELMYEKMDRETEQWILFLDMWYQEIGEKPVTVSELMKILESNENLNNSLPDMLADRGFKGYTRRLGKALARRDGVRYPNGLMLVRAGSYRRAVSWKVMRFEDGKSSDETSSEEGPEDGEPKLTLF
jgi:hypothetical protein